jgi:hypothetical protein
MSVVPSVFSTGGMIANLATQEFLDQKSVRALTIAKSAKFLNQFDSIFNCNLFDDSHQIHGAHFDEFVRFVKSLNTAVVAWWLGKLLANMTV